MTPEKLTVGCERHCMDAARLDDLDDLNYLLDRYAQASVAQDVEQTDTADDRQDFFGDLIHAHVGNMTRAATQIIAEHDAEIRRLKARVKELNLKLDDAFASSPQVREWIGRTKPPVGPGEVDTPAALRQRIDAAVPRAITELRAEVADRDNTIARLERDLASDERLIAHHQAERDALTDRLIDAWHDGHGKDLTLHAYLGLTWEQYQQRFGPPPTTTPAVPETQETTP